jgi:hypothetical protein
LTKKLDSDYKKFATTMIKRLKYESNVIHTKLFQKKVINFNENDTSLSFFMDPELTIIRFYVVKDGKKEYQYMCNDDDKVRERMKKLQEIKEVEEAIQEGLKRQNETSESSVTKKAKQTTQTDNIDGDLNLIELSPQINNTLDFIDDDIEDDDIEYDNPKVLDVNLSQLDS